MTCSPLFRPVILPPDHRWFYTPFDLKFDAKWTNQPGSEVHMTPSESILISVVDRQPKLNGIRFATGADFVAVASGRKLKIILTTRVELKLCAFRVVYIPQDLPHSGYYYAYANTSPSTFSFVFFLPEGSEARTHWVVVEPQENVTLEVIEAKVEVL